MRQFSSHPGCRSISSTRMGKALLAVLVVGVITSAEMVRPWLAPEHNAAMADEAASVPADSEIVIPGPNDLDEKAEAHSKELLGLVTDGTPLKPREMPAYWQFMQWSQTQSTADLDQRALHDIPFTQLCEQPEKYRGKLISLRLHVRRVLKYDAPENPLEQRDVYEAWGWTDESRSYPYVVVLSQCPKDLPIGTEVRGEVTFVGYFLKVMSNGKHGSPLLVGRVQMAAPSVAPRQPLDPLAVWLMVGGGVAVAGLIVWRTLRSKSMPKVRSLPDDVAALDGLGSIRGATNGDTITDSPEREQVGK